MPGHYDPPGRGAGFVASGAEDGMVPGQFFSGGNSHRLDGKKTYTPKN